MTARLTLYRYRLRFTEPLVTARGRFTHREGLLLRLTDDAGRHGWGDAAPWPGFSQATCDELAVLVEQNHQEIVAGSSDVSDIKCAPLPVLPASIAGTSELRFAVETAMLDLLAQSRRLSICRLMSADTCSLLPVNALVGDEQREHLEKRLHTLVAEGFRTIKIKLGSGDPETDIDRATHARHVLGDDTALRFDLNRSWTMTDAVTHLSRLAVLRPEYIEEPVKSDDLRLLRDLQQQLPAPLALDETLTDTATALRAITEDAASVYILKPQFHGGFSGAATLAHQAGDRGHKVVVTSALESAVGVAAAAHFAAAYVGDTTAHGLATGSLFEQDVCANPLRIDRGIMTLPSVLGLGVTPDESLLGKPIGEWP